MIKKLSVVFFALAFGAAIYVPSASACPGMEKSVEKEKKEEAPKTAKKAKSEEKPKSTAKKNTKKTKKKEAGTKVSKK